MLTTRDTTRVFLNATDITQQTQKIESDPATVVLTTGDFLYIGFSGPFAARHVDVSTANTNAATLTVEYYRSNGTWAEVDDVVDETASGGIPFAQSGFIHWQNKLDWKPVNITGLDADIELYFVRISTSADFSAGTAVNSVLNLFSDDSILSEYYPEFISDTRWLPSGQTSYLKQHKAAKDLCVLKLKQRGLIDRESQIVDINEITVAAVHAVAKIILDPIATTDVTIEKLNRAQQNFIREIGSTRLNTDQTKDGVIQDSERATVGTSEIVRR